MGACLSRNSITYACEEDPSIFIQKMMLLQQKISAILKQREEDNEAFEQEMMVFALKEAEWRKERKKLKEELKRLRRSLEEREERIRKMEEKAVTGVVAEVVAPVVVPMAEKGERESESSSSSGGGGSMMLVEQMRMERARRDETVEKWKMLYLAIKTELDDLIQRTHQGALYWRAEEEDLVEELQQELKVNDETIKFLKAQIASLKDEENKRKREVDILRQSLKILSSKKGSLYQHLLSTPL